jgi:phospholipase C
VGRESVTRRGFLGGLAAAGSGLVLGACSKTTVGNARTTSTTGARGSSTSSTPTTTPLATTTTLAVGARPNPAAPAGKDMLPQFDHLVVCMLENHSFDNMIGMAGRGDGLSIGPAGLPTNSNPYPPPGTRRLRSFHMPTPCQTGSPSQDWNASHTQLDNGTCQGFVTSASGPVAMGYYTDYDMPFTYGLARTFPVSDRWFCSVLAQTLPNRRYLLAGTSIGLINDSLLKPLPANGTILDSFNRHGISWKNYYKNLPSIYCWFGLFGQKAIESNVVAIDEFYKDCAAGSLPSFSIVDPNFTTSSEENPQDVQYGEVFLAKVVNAVMASPKWDRTLLVWTYDEHGGYYDHVPPPSAPTPDDIPPDLASHDVPGSFDRFGFRVPFGLVSPYAKKDYVSHTICDHTSILKLCETKWNLPTLTRRDAAANLFLDMVDFDASPPFRVPPRLPAAANPALRASCQSGNTGVIPPPSAITS